MYILHVRRKAVLSALLGCALWSGHAQAQVDRAPFLGQLMMTAANFCPKGWKPADGQIILIAQYSALFYLLGTTYGGDGAYTFGLPDLRGRTPLHRGTGPGLDYVDQGEAGGRQTVTLLQTNMPMHTHTQQLAVTTAPATHAAPAAGRRLAQAQNAGIYADGGTNTTISAGETAAAGGGQPFSVRNPYLGMLWCIAVEGEFPVQD
jgi:microcystin-dependent protein